MENGSEEQEGMVERLGKMRKGRGETSEKESRERIEKRKKLKRRTPFLEFSRSGPAIEPLFLQVLWV